MASLSLKGIQKIYPNGFHAVKDFNLEIADKEFIIFVGPSGCGKSTTLRMIAGLEDISDGTFKIDGKVMNNVEAKDRDIAMVFQNYALYPHMTVYDNMAFGLKLRKVPKAEIDKKVREAARILDLEKLLDRKPKALSGGQRKRVAMGRSIVHKEYLRITYDSTSHSNTLSLTTGKSLRFTIKKFLKVKDSCSFTNCFINLIFRNFTKLQSECHVIIYGHMRIQSVVLEYHCDITVFWLYIVHNFIANL